MRRALRAISTVYLGLPMLIFTIGWLRRPLALSLSAALSLAVFALICSQRDLNAPAGEKGIRVPLWKVLVGLMLPLWHGH